MHCALQDRLIGDVLDEHGFTQAFGSDEYGVGPLLDEGKRHKLFDESTLALLRPVPVEVGDRFETAQARVIEAAFERAAGALASISITRPSHGSLMRLCTCVAKPYRASRRSSLHTASRLLVVGVMIAAFIVDLLGQLVVIG